MKLQVPKQFICYITAFILFLSGVWMEMPSADVAFLYAQETMNMEYGESVLSEGVKPAKVECVSTIEVFRYNTISYLSSNRVQNGINYFARNVVLLTTVVILLLYLMCYAYLLKGSAQSLRNSHTAIITYIQQKDGKK